MHSVLNLEIRLDITILISCPTMIFAWYLLFMTATTKNPTSQRYHRIKTKEAQFNLETVNYLDLEVCMVSNRCHYVSRENVKYAWEFSEALGFFKVQFRNCRPTIYYSKLFFIYHIPNAHLAQLSIFRLYN